MVAIMHLIVREITLPMFGFPDGCNDGRNNGCIHVSSCRHNVCKIDNHCNSLRNHAVVAAMMDAIMVAIMDAIMNAIMVAIMVAIMDAIMDAIMVAMMVAIIRYCMQ